MIDDMKFWLARQLVEVGEFAAVIIVALVSVWWITRSNK
jgi:hypothetical protein